MSSATKIIEQLRSGKVGLLPSDTIYGLSCVALNKEAVERIYELKGRDYGKPLIILLADVKQAEQLGIDLHKLEPVRQLWPASLTVIVRAGQKTPEFLSRDTQTLAVRVPDNENLRKLISQTGPLVSTSANPQGKTPARNVQEAKGYFGDKLDFYIDAGELEAQPSTLAQIKDGKLQIIRQGAYKLPANKLY